VFAGRGISLDALYAAPGDPASLTLRFVATPKLKEHLARRLLRMRDVDEVTIGPARRAARERTT
jgi:hypothetical protein